MDDTCMHQRTYVSVILKLRGGYTIQHNNTFVETCPGTDLTMCFIPYRDATLAINHVDGERLQGRGNGGLGVGRLRSLLGGALAQRRRAGKLPLFIKRAYGSCVVIVFEWWCTEL